MGCFSLSWWYPLRHKHFKVWLGLIYFFLCFLLSYVRNCLIHGYNGLCLCFLLRVFIVLTFTCRFLIYFQFFFFFLWPHWVAYEILVLQLGIEPVTPALEAQSLNQWTAREVLFGVKFCIGRVPASFFCTCISSCPSVNCWKDYFFLHWIVLAPLSEITWPRYRVYFWTLTSVQLICTSVLMPILYCLEVTYCSFVLSYAIGKSSSFFLFSRFVLAVLDLLNFHIDFRIGLSVFSKRELEFW